MATGRFQPGHSGNPGGRPKIERQIVELCRGSAAEAIETLLSVMRAGKPAEALAAANAILDRAFGKPKQVAEHRLPGTLRELSNDELLEIIAAGGAGDQPVH